MDKKDFKEYFALNLIVEIQNNNKNKNSSLSLIELNTSVFDSNKKNKIQKINNNILNKNEQKDFIRTEKIKLKKIRKKKIIEKKKIIKKEKMLAKLEKKKKKKTSSQSIFKKNKPPIVSTKIMNVELKQIKEDKPKKSAIYKNIKLDNPTSVCKNIKDCDIDKIANFLIKRAKEKKFPDIASK